MEQNKPLIISMFFHGLLNLQGTKYGVEPTKDMLKNSMKHGFKRICISYEALVATMVCFSIYTIMSIIL
jgi:hypothetical protein